MPTQPEPSPPQSVTFEDVIDLLKSGPVVPLLGAGLSVKAGIPLIADLKPYLARLIWVFDGLRKHFATKPFPAGLRAEHLLALHGLPTHHELAEEGHLFGNADPTVRGRSSKDTLSNVTHLGYKSCAEKSLWWLTKKLHEWHRIKCKISRVEYRQAIENACDWRDLLRDAGGGDDATVDRVFDRLLRGRRPVDAHRLLALLIRHWDCQVILSTNFDRLLEDALRAERLDPVVYDVPLDSELPHPNVVRSNRAYLKLHGGAYGLRADRTLDLALTQSARMRLLDYMTTGAVLLALGSGGTEQRVIDFVTDYANVQNDPGDDKDGKKAQDPVKVIWVYRDKPPEFVG